MAPLANVPDLEARLQRSVTSSAAILALDGASAQIRDDVGWSITAETGVSLTLDGTGERSLWLPTLYLTDVVSVVEDGVPLTVVDDFDWTSYGRLIRVGGCWPDKPRSVVVTIDHGYPADSPKVVKPRDICLSLAGRMVDNPSGLLRSSTVGGVSQVYAVPVSGDPALVLTKAEREALAPLRLP